MILCGRSKSGKTTLLMNLLVNKSFHLLKMFDEIYVWSPTAFSDLVWRAHRLDNEHYFPRYQESDLLKTMKAVRDANRLADEKKQARLKTLFIFDDCGAEHVRTGNFAQNAFDELVLNLKNFNVSLIWSGQQIEYCTLALRRNAEYSFIFQQWNTDEKALIYKDFGFGSFDVFNEHFTRITSELHHFLFVDRTSGIPQYYHNFDKKLKITYYGKKTDGVGTQIHFSSKPDGTSMDGKGEKQSF
jgi:hypothetical protein